MKENREHLLEKLVEYGKSDFYPFHMPGHKRRCVFDFPNPYSMDITEIEGFDNLHHAEGILKDSMEETARIYGTDKSYYLVNGSTCGILSAICGCTKSGGTILMARNCHKAAYHGTILHHLVPEYLYPEYIAEFGINGGILPDDVECALKKNSRIQAVLIVSPTYDGIVSDVKKIADIAHEYGVPLIVDEAHGAHLTFADRGDGEKKFPKSALECGADVVIESLHKTLPSLTQTAILHIKSKLVNPVNVERYLGMFQSSSPSYVFMASMEKCVRFMDVDGREEMKRYEERMVRFFEDMKELKVLKVLDWNVRKEKSVFDWDMSKVVVSTKHAGFGGEKLCKILGEKYHIEMEMSAPEYAVALTSLMDTEEGLDRLACALKEIDRMAAENSVVEDGERSLLAEIPKAVPVISLADALDREGVKMPVKESSGKISQEFIYLYPPGIPILAPGEQITEDILKRIQWYDYKGLSVQGPSDPSLSSIITVAEE